MTKEELGLRLLTQIDLLFQQTELVREQVERMVVRCSRWPWFRDSNLGPELYEGVADLINENQQQEGEDDE